MLEVCGFGETVVKNNWVEPRWLKTTGLEVLRCGGTAHRGWKPQLSLETAAPRKNERKKNKNGNSHCSVLFIF